MNLKRTLKWFQYGFLTAGIICLGVYSYVWLDTELYQSYENWSFDRALAGRNANMFGFVADKLLGRTQEEELGEAPIEERFSELEGTSPAPEVSRRQELIGRIQIPRLKVNAIVREGVDNRTLRRAVGHIPGTARPGEEGNIGLAAHRDTFFRPLRDVQKNDRIMITTLEGTYEFEVESLKIVSPQDVSVLRDNGSATVTLVTCYPFNYVGSAPKRFIVQARQISSSSRLSPGS
jgi:sortase A